MAANDDWLRSNVFQSTCTILGKVCRFVIDAGSCDNFISSEAIQKLGLKMEAHPDPYTLSWLERSGEVAITTRALVPFSIGARYKDEIWCDVVDMEACHLLLGRPWQFDRAVLHNGRENTYSFKFEGVKIILIPQKRPEKQAPKENAHQVFEEAPKGDVPQFDAYNNDETPPSDGDSEDEKMIPAHEPICDPEDTEVSFLDFSLPPRYDEYPEEEGVGVGESSSYHDPFLPPNFDEEDALMTESSPIDDMKESSPLDNFTEVIIKDWEIDTRRINDAATLEKIGQLFWLMYEGLGILQKKLYEPMGTQVAIMHYLCAWEHDGETCPMLHLAPRFVFDGGTQLLETNAWSKGGARVKAHGIPKRLVFDPGGSTRIRGRILPNRGRMMRGIQRQAAGGLTRPGRSPGPKKRACGSNKSSPIRTGPDFSQKRSTVGFF